MHFEARSISLVKHEQVMDAMAERERRRLAREAVHAMPAGHQHAPCGCEPPSAEGTGWLPRLIGNLVDALLAVRGRETKVA